MKPFEDYPYGGREPLGHSNKDACRTGYELELQRLTGQTCCAYCGVSLVDDYYRWLLVSVDHVVPRSAALLLGIPPAYTEDFFNQVLCCSGCNRFGNRYAVPPVLGQALPEWQRDRFVELRDRVFNDRRERIAKRRAIERAHFERQPWVTEPSGTTSYPKRAEEQRRCSTS